MLAVYFSIGDLRTRLAVPRKEATWTDSLDKLLRNTSVMVVRATHYFEFACHYLQATALHLGSLVIVLARWPIQFD
jgi:hypothetical protein